MTVQRVNLRRWWPVLIAGTALLFSLGLAWHELITEPPRPPSFEEPWFQGPTLWEATLGEWRKARFEVKLPSTEQWLAARWQGPVDTTESINRIREVSQMVVDGLDEFARDVSRDDITVGEILATATYLMPGADTAPAAQEEQWHVVGTWDGVASKTTDYFYIPSGEWRVRADLKPIAVSGFAVSFRDRNDRWGGSDTFVPGGANQISYHHGLDPGDFYADVSAMEHWSFTIEAKY